MVLFNHSTRELTAKIVYYGPGLCGKTTNLRLLHEKLDQGTTGRLLSLSTAQDRTIYFDLLPVELGNVKGYTVRFQLCTVPGQVFYNETRKLVLKGVDGIVFVVDSQWSMLSHNLESFQNLRENMAELGQGLDDTAIVIQYNKRDLPGVLSIQAIQESLGFQDYPFVESVAADAKGVVETFKLVSKLTFVQLLKRLQRSPDGERLGPDWLAATPPDSQQTARIPAVGAELLALTSTVGPAPAPPTDSPFETTGSWPDLPRGEVFGEATVPPFTVGVDAKRPAAPQAAPAVFADPDDTLTDELPPPPVREAGASDETVPLPELDREPEPEPTPEPEPEPGPEPEPEPTPEPGPEPEPAPEPAAEAETAPEPAADQTAPPEAVPAPEAVPPPPPAPEPPPPFAAVWAEAFAGLSVRLEEMSRDRAEESARLAASTREMHEAVAAIPGNVRQALAALAPAAAVETLREALEAHTAEVRPKILGLVEEAARQREAYFERERQQDDAAQDAARRHREEIRGDVERATAAVREVVIALESRVAELKDAVESRLGSLEAAVARLEASDRSDEVRREMSEVKLLVEGGIEASGRESSETKRLVEERLGEVRRESSEVRRLVEERLEEAGGQSRRLSGFLRRALEELDPPGRG